MSGMKRWWSGLLCLLLMACPQPRCAAEASVAAYGRGIEAYQLQRSGAETVQAWIDQPLAMQAGVNAEWYVIALAQSGEYNFTAYRDALKKYLEENTLPAVTRQKCALALAAAGGREEPCIAQVAAETIGTQGLMSWVYGLHLLNNGFAGSVTAEEIIGVLLERQLEDGGWALSGAVSDVDVTAMTLQALAPHVDAMPAVAEAAAQAVELLSRRQLEDGGYASFGTPNPESAAQVIVALAALGVDAMEDARFIKGGNTIAHSMGAYRMEDGSFSHTAGGAGNANAMAQVYLAAAAYQRMQDGRAGIYLLDAPAAAPAAAPVSGRLIAVMVILGAAAAACLILFIAGKRHRNNFLAVIALAAVLTVLVYAIDVQPAESYYSGVLPDKGESAGTVTMAIRCDSVAGAAPHIPADGVILPVTSFTIARGDTAFAILLEAAQAHGIHVEHSGGQELAYVSGIANLYEYDWGDLSGWVYYINGDEPSSGCGQCTLKDGDVIEWHYSREMGKDIQ